MTVDYLPSVKAFCEERLKKLRPTVEGHPTSPDRQWAINELEMVVTLCDGLAKQNEMLTEALKPK